MNNSKLFSDEAANIYERAIGTLLKKNMLLYFSFADYEEVSVHPSNQTYKCPFFSAHSSKIVLGATEDRPASFSFFTESHEVREGPQHIQ